MKYLARYTHKAAISNHRLVDLSNGRVRSRGKDYAHGGRQGTMTLDAIEFVRRSLRHVLPSGFVRIRHDGLLAHRHRREELERCRELLGVAVTPKADANPTDPVTPPGREATVTPTRVCPLCGAGRMIVVAELRPVTPAQEISTGPAPCVTCDSS